MRTRSNENESLTDVTLARRLLAEQHPQWADLPLTPIDHFGTDHDVYRIGQDASLRLPRTDWAATQARKEAELLPRLEPHVTLAVPRVLAHGNPTPEYRFAWSVQSWLPGQDLVGRALDGDTQLAADLATFVGSLREVGTADAPSRPATARGGDLGGGDAAVENRLQELERVSQTRIGCATPATRAGGVASARKPNPGFLRERALPSHAADAARSRPGSGRHVLGDRVDGIALARAWQQSRAAAHPTEERWTHGDLLPGNLLATDGRLSGVIDFGALNVTDPALDLTPCWYLLGGTGTPAAQRFLRDLAATPDEVLRARGWAQLQALNALPYYWDTNPGMVRLAGTALRLIAAEV